MASLEVSIQAGRVMEQKMWEHTARLGKAGAMTIGWVCLRLALQTFYFVNSCIEGKLFFFNPPPNMKHRATIKQQNETIDITVRHGQASAPRTTNRVWGGGRDRKLPPWTILLWRRVIHSCKRPLVCQEEQPDLTQEKLLK